MGGAIRMVVRNRGRHVWCRLDRGKSVVFVLAGLCALIAAIVPGIANPRSSIVNRDYRVRGDTERSLVTYMKSQPLRGDKGPAVANVRPRYKLTIETRKLAGETRKLTGSCRIEKLDLSIRFVMTLPRAMDSARFSARTKRTWAGFRGFAKRHENRHRGIYLQCARTFLRDARRLSDPHSCAVLRRRVNAMLRKHKTDCERLNDAFDRRELPRLKNLPLFRNARSAARRQRGKSIAVSKSKHHRISRQEGR